MQLSRYSFGLGDRFGYEGLAQLRAMQMALDRGVTVTPVWNKSNREHSLIGTAPDGTRRAASAAVAATGWTGPYLVDADHITIGTVDAFLPSSDYFTIDVAEAIGQAPDPVHADEFLRAMTPLAGDVRIAGLSQPLRVTVGLVRSVAAKYLRAVEEAARVYRRIEQVKGAGTFITEVSLDEADEPQSAAELFLILGAMGRAGIPVQTIAPKFTGSFLKGVDYVGDVGAFAREFADDIGVIAFAREKFGLPPDLKLSIHSGSDKFSLYPVIRRIAGESGAGFHLKTAGTTWLEEVIGLSLAGADGRDLVAQIYALAYDRFDELIAPYRSVVAIDRSRLPRPEDVLAWDAERFAETLEHEPSRARFNPQFRQLVHVAFKIAAEMGPRFTSLLERHRAIVEAHVTDNIFRRHLTPLYLGEAGALHSDRRTERMDHES